MGCRLLNYKKKKRAQEYKDNVKPIECFRQSLLQTQYVTPINRKLILFSHQLGFEYNNRLGYSDIGNRSRGA